MLPSNPIALSLSRFLSRMEIEVRGPHRASPPDHRCSGSMSALPPSLAPPSLSRVVISPCLISHHPETISPCLITGSHRASEGLRERRVKESEMDLMIGTEEEATRFEGRRRNRAAILPVNPLWFIFFYFFNLVIYLFFIFIFVKLGD